MKNQSTLLLIILSLACSSCATLDISEIKNPDKIAFEPLKLSPDNETNDLRIDLIRQSYDENINDSTKETKPAPYHPVGFDLGNGLFYDLNGNLCLRIDYLLGISSNDNFELQEINRPQKNKKISTYKFSNDSMTIKYRSAKKPYNLYYRDGSPDSTVYMHRNHLQYAIVKSDSSLIYSVRRRNRDVIHKKSDGVYYINRRKKHDLYKIAGNEVNLANAYTIDLVNNNLTLQIKSGGIRKTRVLFTIERSPDKIFVYNKRYQGLMIESGDNNIEVYYDKWPVVKYALVQ